MEPWHDIAVYALGKLPIDDCLAVMKEEVGRMSRREFQFLDKPDASSLELSLQLGRAATALDDALSEVMSWLVPDTG
jgi:hypothetical protein